MAQKRYFQLNDDVGLNPVTGKADPIAAVGLVVAVPRMVKGELLVEQQRLEIKVLTDQELAGRKQKPPARILPSSRLIEVDEPRVADGLAGSGQYREVDPPEKKALDEHRKEIEANVREASAAAKDEDEEG